MRLRTFGLLLLIASEAQAATYIGEVVGVSDGDTVTLLTAGKVRHRIRLDGIDAPERTQPYSQVSKQSLSGMVYRERVVAECSKLDRYSREVCKVLVDGRDVGLVQIQRGLAWHFKRYEGEQSAADRMAYAEAEAEAKSARRGLWRDAYAVAPWEFRASKQRSD